MAPELSHIQDAPASALTILIPSKGRPEMLAALLHYYSAMRVPYPILVLLSAKRKDYLPQDYPGLNLRVMECDENISLHDKLKAGVATISTSIITLCTDDDIVLPGAIAKAGGFLMENPQYSACQGYHALFSEQENVTNLVKVEWFTPSLASDDPLERLKSLIARYQPVCWAVFRATALRTILDTFSPELNFLFLELLWSGTAALTGKVKRLPMIYCLRRIDRMHFMGHPVFAMMESPQRFFHEYALYREMLLRQLPAAGTPPRDQLERLVDLMHIHQFSRETSAGTWSYFINEAMRNPSVSIHDADIDKALRSPEPDVRSGWEKEVAHGGRKYRLFPQMLHPEPREEILLSPGFEDGLIADISRYFA